MNRKIKAFIAFALFLTGSYVSTAQDYSEQYRPQFHFSPKSGWIGDPDGTTKIATAKVINLLGQTLKEIIIFPGNSPSELDISDLETGYYILSVLSNNEILNQQFIKAN